MRTHSVPDQPSFSESGVSWTIMMPSARSEMVRMRMCKSVFQTRSPLFIREPSAKGIDMPTMNRNPGNTRSTKVMPLPPRWRSLKCTIQSGTNSLGAPARSFTKIIVNIRKPRRASMEVMRGARGTGALGVSAAVGVGDSAVSGDMSVLYGNQRVRVSPERGGR